MNSITERDLRSNRALRVCGRLVEEARFLKKIKHIGVREESGQKLVKEIANRDVPVVCDPTLLFTGDEWMAIQQKEPIVK